MARSIVSSPASADEVVQDTWLAVVQSIGSFEARSSLKTWVYRILVNTAKRRAMREGRQVTWGLVPGEDDGPTVDPARFGGPGDRFPGHWLAFPARGPRRSRARWPARSARNWRPRWPTCPIVSAS